MSNTSKKRLFLKETANTPKQPKHSATLISTPSITARPPSSSGNVTAQQPHQQNNPSAYFAMQRYASPMKPVRVVSGRHALPTMKSLDKTRSMLEQVSITQALEFISHKLSSHLTQSMSGTAIMGTNTKDKITSLQNEMNFSLSQIIDKLNSDSLKVNELYIHYHCDNKDDLVTSLAKHVNYLRYYVKKLADLFFVYNVKYLESDSEDINSVSVNEYGINDFENIQLFLRKLDDVFEFSNSNSNNNNNRSSYWQGTSNKNNGDNVTQTFDKCSTINRNTGGRRFPLRRKRTPSP